jgi:hypothetical protein
MRKRLLLAAGVVIVLAVIAAAVWLPPLARIGVGYTAQQTCACLFVSHRSADDCHRDLEPLARLLISVEVRPDEVATGSFGLARARATYQRGLGCTLKE